MFKALPKVFFCDVSKLKKTKPKLRKELALPSFHIFLCIELDWKDNKNHLSNKIELILFSFKLSSGNLIKQLNLINLVIFC